MLRISFSIFFGKVISNKVQMTSGITDKDFFTISARLIVIVLVRSTCKKINVEIEALKKP